MIARDDALPRRLFGRVDPHDMNLHLVTYTEPRTIEQTPFADFARKRGDHQRANAEFEVIPCRVDQATIFGDPCEPESLS